MSIARNDPSFLVLWSTVDDGAAHHDLPAIKPLHPTGDHRFLLSACRQESNSSSPEVGTDLFNNEANLINGEWLNIRAQHLKRFNSGKVS